MADAEQTLRDLLNNILDEKNYRPRDIKIKAVNSGGANFTSAIFFVTVTSPDRDDLKLFAKVAIVGDLMRSCMNADWLFSTERFVYTKLVKIYKDIEDTHNVPAEHRYVFPKFYGHKAEYAKETIVLENLVENGYKTYNRFNSMDWEHASAGVQNLAKFHALSFAFAETNPEEFANLTSNMTFETGNFNGEMDESSIAKWMELVEGVVQHVREDQKDSLRNFIRANNKFDKYNRPFGKPVIAHGDYKMCNLLFRRQDKTLEAITVDYQTVHAGNPATDLIYFIFLGTDEEFRKHYYEKLLDHYYKNLELALERLSIIPHEVYPRTKLYKDMRTVLPLAVLLGVMILPVITVDAENAPKTDEDANENTLLLTSNQLYAERFRGLVNDCIKWGAL